MTSTFQKLKNELLNYKPLIIINAKARLKRVADTDTGKHESELTRLLNQFIEKLRGIDQTELEETIKEVYTIRNKYKSLNDLLFDELAPNGLAWAGKRKPKDLYPNFDTSTALLKLNQLFPFTIPNRISESNIPFDNDPEPLFHYTHSYLSIGVFIIDDIIRALNLHLPTDKIDWIEVFNSIDIEKKFNTKAYITTTIKEQKNYFSEASYSTTLQYLQKFKKDTWLLDDKRKLEFVERLDLQKPSISNTGSSLFNQTAFEAKSNFYEFIQAYKDQLIKGLPPQVTERQNPELPKNFDEMFEFPELIKDCINVLRTVTPPIINNQDKYNLGSKSKGSFVAWITALKKKGLISAKIPDMIIAKHLNERFKGLDLGKDGRTLRNPNTTAYKKYYTTLLNLLPDLPLSTEGKNR